MFKGLGNLANLGNLIQQAQGMSGRMQDAMEKMRLERITGSAGGGMVQAEVNGLGEVLSVSIEPALIAKGDQDTIQTLLPAALNQAIGKAKEKHAESMKSLAGGLNIPGLDDALRQFIGNTGNDGDSTDADR